MEVIKKKYFRFVELAEGVYAAIAPAEPLDITDAGMMDNFSNSSIVLNGGGLVCDTCFDLPHAEELKDFCIEKTGHAPEYVVNTHGHWDHFWGNQVFLGPDTHIMGHRGMLDDCRDDRKKVPVFRKLHGSAKLQKFLDLVITAAFKDYLSAGVKAHMVVKQTDHDFDLTGLVPALPSLLFDEKTTLQLGDTIAEIIPVGAVHSSSDTVVWLPKEKVLLAGDVFADCSMPMNLEAAVKWLKVLDYILDELKPLYIVPGHGEVYDYERACSQRDYFKALVSQFNEYYNDTISEKDLLAKIDVSEFIDHRPRLAWVMAAKNFFKEKRNEK